MRGVDRGAAFTPEAEVGQTFPDPVVRVTAERAPLPHGTGPANGGSTKQTIMNTPCTLRGALSKGPLAVALSGALLLGSVPAVAQEPTTTTLQTTTSTTVAPEASSGMESAFGVKGGVNWSNLWVKEVNDNNARFGFHVGLFGRFASPGKLGFQVEALYDQKGSSVRKNFGVIDQEITYKFDYVTVPLLVIIPVGEVLEIQGGAYLGYMVLSETTSKGDLGTDYTDPKDSKFNGFDYGLVGGLGINVGKMAQLGVRYEHGLNEIANNPISNYVLGSSKNSTLQAYVAIAIGK